MFDLTLRSRACVFYLEVERRGFPEFCHDGGKIDVLRGWRQRSVVTSEVNADCQSICATLIFKETLKISKLFSSLIILRIRLAKNLDTPESSGLADL